MDDFKDDFQDEEEEEKEFMYGGRDGLIFLVDATLPMFARGVEDDIPFKTCIDCCKTTMLNKIISSDHDLVSVVLFGTSMTDNELKAAHITTLQELSEPSAAKIKQLETIANSGDFDDFAGKYGHSNDFLLSDALWLCQNIFSKSVCKLSSSRILLLTNTSDPHCDKPNAQHQARVRAGDLALPGIHLELLHMGRHFDASVFYKELLQLSKGDSGEDFDLPDSTSKIDELLERICRVDYKKRAQCELAFNLGHGVTLGVNLYTLIRKATAPKYVQLDQASNEPVKAVRETLNVDTAEIMLPAELCYGLTVANKQVKFGRDEKRALRSIMQPGIDLLGFKPRDAVKIYEHIQSSAFIYPSEDFIQGSRQLFTTLLERCVARSVVPICYMTARLSNTPKLVALVPQLETKKKSGLQLNPPGFHVVFLPFQDQMVREEEEEEPTGHASDAQIAILRDVVLKLRFKYSETLFQNPMLQVHWSNLEALALDQPEPREVIDYSLPNSEEMKKQLGVQSLVRKFVSSLYASGYDPLSTKKPPQKRGGAAAGRAAKVAKTNDASQGASTAQRLSQL